MSSLNALMTSFCFSIICPLLFFLALPASALYDVYRVYSSSYSGFYSREYRSFRQAYENLGGLPRGSEADNFIRRIEAIGYIDHQLMTLFGGYVQAYVLAFYGEAKNNELKNFGLAIQQLLSNLDSTLALSRGLHCDRADELRRHWAIYEMDCEAVRQLLSGLDVPFVVVGTITAFPARRLVVSEGAIPSTTQGRRSRLARSRAYSALEMANALDVFRSALPNP